MKAASVSNIRGVQYDLSRAAEGMPEKVRVEAMSEMADFATHDAKGRQAMWQDSGTRSVLLAGARWRQPPSVRRQALRCLSSLAADAENREPMWAATRSALLAAAADGQSGVVRRQALWALVNLSTDSASVQREMWQDTKDDRSTRPLLLDCAASVQAEEVRVLALWALCNLASEPENKAAMWEDAGEGGVRALLLGCARASGLEDAPRLLQQAPPPPNLSGEATALRGPEGPSRPRLICR